ncbi:MAG: NADP-dependent malic enzyme, partial [Flavobacteriales bacterium CG_4_8_14_3_um_filter_35_10]
IELVDKTQGVNRIAAANIMLTKRGPIFFSDTAVNINPSSKELANIANMTAHLMSIFGIKPNLAMLSYSNFGNSDLPEAKKVTDAVAYLHEFYPELNVDGEIQADFALTNTMLNDKFPFSKLNNNPVNGLIFPNLDSANISYKILKSLNNIESVGPIVMGFNKAVHIIQYGCDIDEIVNMTSIAVVDAQEKANQ